MNDTLTYSRFDALLQQQGWVTPAYVGVSDNGLIQYLSEDPPTENQHVEEVHGYALPGFPNAHSHAFQYAMAGQAEKHAPGITDDFWSWRKAMYDCALTMQPDHVEAIAAMLYAEMVRMGYTHVVEFHYLHHDINGSPYANLAEMGERLICASTTAGIHLTLVPVFYQMGGFGIGPESKQRRFISKDVEEYFKLLDATRVLVEKNGEARMGFGVHSLRAVNARDIRRTFENGPKDWPFHLHASEQLMEVAASKEYLGLRPVEWLLENLPVNCRFNFVHATHLNEVEVERLAQSQANVILCPGTEGNLGDGIFRLTDFATHYGSWAIGTDSHISLNPLEDIRWLDYGQRLLTHRRNTFSDGATVMLNKIIPAGRSAAGISTDNFFEIGHPFDAVVVKANSPLVVSARPENVLSTIIYTSDPSCFEGTIIRGRWIVRNQIHIRASQIRNAFERCIRELHSSF